MLGLLVQTSASTSDVPAPDTIKVRVSDGGPGIPEADRTRIFDRFVRLDEARTGNGTGLGLPIAKWIADAHEAVIDVESTPDRGSTFKVTFPLSPTFRISHVFATKETPYD